MPSEARQKIWKSKEIAINCSINNNFSHHYKKTKKHKKNTNFCFLKTLAGKTVILLHYITRYGR